MTQDRKRQQEPIRLLVDLLAEDILAASDAEILAEMREDGDDPDRAASDMLGVFERALILSNKSRLAAARLAVAAERQSRGAAPIIDIADARRQLRDALMRKDLPLTMAARNENELSDADVIGLVQDMRELGILPSDDESDGH